MTGTPQPRALLTACLLACNVTLAGCVDEGPGEQALVGLLASTEFERDAWDLGTAEAAVERMGFTVTESNATNLRAVRDETRLQIDPHYKTGRWWFAVTFPETTGWQTRSEFENHTKEREKARAPEFEQILHRFENETNSKAVGTYGWSPQSNIK